MNPDNGIVGSEQDEEESAFDIEYNTLSRQIAKKKVVIEEVWHETINPLVSPDAVFDEDLDLFQYYGNKALTNNSARQRDQVHEDRKEFQTARKDTVYTEKQLLTVKVKKHAKTAPSIIQKLKHRVKVKPKP